MIAQLKAELERIRGALEDYLRLYRKEALPPIEPSGVYALFPDRLNSDDAVNHRWDDRWPDSTKSGVYFLFTDDGKLLYIGTARCIGARLGKYFHYDTDRRCKIVRTWSHNPFYVVTLGVPKGMGFEAAALEYYFIEKLDPPENKIGRVRDDVSSEAKIA